MTSESQSALVEMSVFERPPTAADELPKELEYRLKSHGCSDGEEMPFGCPGDAIGAKSRLLLSGLGMRKTSLYAWPTTTAPALLNGEVAPGCRS
jgi:hypothetical protein